MAEDQQKLEDQMIWSARRIQFKLTADNSNEMMNQSQLSYILGVLTDLKLIITSETNLVYAALLIQLVHLRQPTMRIHLYLDCERTPHDLMSLFLMQEVRFKETCLILLDRKSYKFDYAGLVRRALTQTEKLSIRFS